MGTRHDIDCEVALRRLTRRRRTALDNAARIIAEASGVSRRALADFLAKSQPGSPFSGKFETELAVIADENPKPGRFLETLPPNVEAVLRNERKEVRRREAETKAIRRAIRDGTYGHGGIDPERFRP
ncbi:MAG: hypothetical protein F4089_06270 [Gammaproteobacteria bacterium]|nr:hypothetical protein [Gammaproteobacteria bacterium]